MWPVTQTLDTAVQVAAPDGSTVRILVRTDRGSMAHFSLPPHAVAHAVLHRTVEEVWYCLAGRGRMWQRTAEQEAIVELEPGVSLTISCGTAFQFRSDSAEPLQVVAVTLPPWPGADEAVPTEGCWTATV